MSFGRPSHASQLRLGLGMESGQLTVPVSMPPGLRMAGFGLSILALFVAMSAAGCSSMPASQPEPSPTATLVATDSQPERQPTDIPRSEPTHAAESGPTAVVEPVPTPTQVAAYATVNLQGVESWRTSFESETPAYNDVAGMAMDELGNVLVAGWSWGTFREHSEFANLDGVLLKLDPAGNQVWRYLIATPFNDRALDVAVAPDGSVYVVGTTYGEFAESSTEGTGEDVGEDQDYFVLKLDENGQEVWVAQHGTSRGPDRADGVVVDQRGDVVVAGAAIDGENGDMWNGFIAKFDGADGSLTWARKVDGTGRSRLTAVKVDRESSIYSGGWIEGDLYDSTSLGRGDGLVLKFSSGGERLWGVRLGSAANDAVKDMVVGAGSDLFVLGDTSGVLTGQAAKGGPGDPLKGPDDLFVARLDDTGETEWSLQIGSGEGDLAGEVALVGNGLLVVTGTSQFFADEYTYVADRQLAYASLMTLDGESRGDYQLPLAGSNNSVRAVDIGPGGGIVFAGSTCVRDPCNYGPEGVNGRVDMYVMEIEVK